MKTKKNIPLHVTKILYAQLFLFFLVSGSGLYYVNKANNTFIRLERMAFNQLRSVEKIILSFQKLSHLIIVASSKPDNIDHNRSIAKVERSLKKIKKIADKQLISSHKKVYFNYYADWHDSWTTLENLILDKFYSSGISAEDKVLLSEKLSNLEVKIGNIQQYIQLELLDITQTAKSDFEFALITMLSILFLGLISTLILHFSGLNLLTHQEE